MYTDSLFASNIKQVKFEKYKSVILPAVFMDTKHGLSHYRATQTDSLKYKQFIRIYLHVW